MKTRSGPPLAGDGVTRRDFVNGALVAAGGLALSPFAPAIAHAAGGDCGDLLAHDRRAARGGNLPSVFNVGHWLRDQRLTFGRGGVTLTPGCDGLEGKFPIVDDGEEADVVIAGGGLAGLSAAFFLMRRRPGVKVHILEANAFVGGNASYDDQAPLPVRASTCGAYTAVPDMDYLIELYRETGLDTGKYNMAAPGDSYFFDEHTPGIKPGFRGWNVGLLAALDRGDKLDGRNAPYEAKVMDDLARSVQAIMKLGSTPGAPDDPPDLSSPKFDDLSTISLAKYLTDTLHCDPRVVDFYTRYTIDCMGGTAHYVNAHTAISFLSSDHTVSLFAYPGGTAQIAIQLRQWLTEAAGAAPPARIDTQAMALSIEADLASSRNKVGVVYYKDGRFRRARGKTLIVATQVQAARRLIEPLLDKERRQAWGVFNSAPALCANVALRNMRPVVDLGLGYSSYWWGGKYWSNFVVADWTSERRLDRDRASVLTFYSHVTAPPEDFPAERMKLLTTPFAEFEQSLQDDLSRMFGGTGFDFKRDVSAIFLYRWGHSMILPGPGSIFGDVRDAKGRIIRAKSPRWIACRPLGPISFAGQYAEGAPSVESAIGSGHRAALELLAQL